MENPKTDSPLSRRIAISFLRFLDKVEISSGADEEALEVAKECLAEVFKIDRPALIDQSNHDSLIDIFSSRETNLRGGNDHAEVSDVPSTSCARNAHTEREQHSNGKDALFVQFLGALEKIHYFNRMADGNDDQVQLDRATSVFHNGVEEMRIEGNQSFDPKVLADTFKSQGNKAMQSKKYIEAIELYTFSIALCDDNAVYYCNRAAAYTQINHYDEAVQDCLKSILINPNYSKAYSRLGFAYYAQGKYRDAIDKGFKRALQLDPTNDAVKENIKVAEQKLREERLNQNSTSTRQGESSQHSGSGSRNQSSPPPQVHPMALNVEGISTDFTNMLRNMAASANVENIFQFQPGPRFTVSQPDPETAVLNTDLDGNEQPEDLSRTFQFSVNLFPPGNPGDSNGRSSAS